MKNLTEAKPWHYNEFYLEKFDCWIYIDRYYIINYLDHGEITVAEYDLGKEIASIPCERTGRIHKLYTDSYGLEHIILELSWDMHQIEGEETKVFSMWDILAFAVYAITPLEKKEK